MIVFWLNSLLVSLLYLKNFTLFKSLHLVTCYCCPLSKATPYSFFNQKMVIIKDSYFIIYATALGWMTGRTPSKYIVFLTFSISNDWSILVLIFFNVIIPSLPIWTILYLKFTLNTLVFVLVYSLHISISPTSYSPFLFSNFLISLDTFLQVSFRYAMLYLDDAILSVYLSMF